MQEVKHGIMWEIKGFCGTLRDCVPTYRAILPTSEEEHVFFRKRKRHIFQG